jgi:hypothetical protein
MTDETQCVTLYGKPRLVVAADTCPGRDDVAVNPNDTEESIWAFLCEARLQGPDAARDNMLKVTLCAAPRWLAQRQLNSGT